MAANNQSKIKFFDGDIDDDFMYLFIDESGNSSKKMWDKIEPFISENGYVSRDISCYTMTGILVKSKKQYGRIVKEIENLKVEIFGKEYKDAHFHRSELFSPKRNVLGSIFNNVNAYKYERGIIKIANNFKLPIFSASFNREIHFLNEKYTNRKNYINKDLDLKELLFEKITKYAKNYCYKNNLSKKIMVVMETEDNYHNNKIFNYFQEHKTYFFENFLFMNKTVISKNDQTQKSLIMNEMVDFINASFFLWAANTPYQLLKFNMPGYPNHFKHSLAIIDAKVVNLK